MKRIPFVMACFVLVVANVYGQKADLEQSQVVNATRENRGRTFRVKVRLKDVGSVPDTQTIKNWEESKLRCYVNRDNFVEATLADRAKLEFNCDFDYAKVRELGTLPIKLTFNARPEDIATALTLFATPVKNDLNVRTTIGDPVWLEGDPFITVPITVDQSVSVTVNLDCSTENIPDGNFGREVVTLTKSISNSVQINLKPNFAKTMACRISVSAGDSLTDIVDFNFLSNDSKKLEPKNWVATVNEPYKISLPHTEVLKDRVILVSSFKPKPVTVTMTRTGDLEMFIDGLREGSPSKNQINHSFTISKETIVNLAKKKVPHTVSFRNGQVLLGTFPLIVDINTKLETSRIEFRDNKLRIEFTLSPAGDAYLRFPELSDFKEVKPLDCKDNGKCEKLFAGETTAFIQAAAKALGADKQKTLNIQIISSANDELISTLQFDVVKVGLDEKKFAELQQKVIEDDDKNFNKNVETYKKEVATSVFGCGNTCTPEENQAIDYLLQKLRKDKGQNKFSTILKFGAKIALAYFGIPIPSN
jgi:hypothetical protein